MLRRLLVLTATALAAAAPAAGASPVFPLPLLSSPDRLTVIVSETGNARTDGRYELACDPAGGTHPAADAACARLDELAREGRDPFAPVAEDQMCTQQAGGPATARVTGTWRGERVDATFSRTNGCEISRWRTLQPVLPNTRS